MDSSYIFSIEDSIRNSVKQFERALKIDREDFERYKCSNYKNDKIVEKWEYKLTAFIDAYNGLELLFNRAITIDHERSTYFQQITRLKTSIKTLETYLNILSVAKKIEVEEQVKYRTEKQIITLCNLSEKEFKEELNKIKLKINSKLSLSKESINEYK